MYSYVKPTSGGILFIIMYTVVAIYQNFYLPLLSIPISIVGLLVTNSSYLIKQNLFSNLQLLSSCFLKIKIQVFKLFLKITFTIFSSYNIMVIINFVNFMDGIDGIVCGCMIIIFISINGTFHYLFPAVGALSAFLIFNWQPSRIFMGDTGLISVLT